MNCDKHSHLKEQYRMVCDACLQEKISGLQAALDSYMDAYLNMRNFAIESGLDVTCYHGPADAGQKT